LDTFMTRLSDDLTRNDLGYVMQLDLFRSGPADNDTEIVLTAIFKR